MYATKLAESDALQTWNQDFHGKFFFITFEIFLWETSLKAFNKKIKDTFPKLDSIIEVTTGVKNEVVKLRQNAVVDTISLISCTIR